MIFTDTHTHLYLDDFDDDREDVIKRAIDNNIKYMLLPNIDSSSIKRLHDLCDRYPDNCLPMMGLHPTSVTENYKEELEIIKSQFLQRKYYAIGEIGIDLYWDKTFKEQQDYAFRKQIEWAIEMNLPIVIHARDSFEEIFNVVDEMNCDELTGVFHCFSGTKQQAEHIINYGGFKLGIGGVLTFKNSGLREEIANIDLKHIILETDSPYLTPAPHRGKRNESSYINNIATLLSEMKNESLETIAEITTNNAIDLFKFK
ncbi:MAG: TatD family hydrolase [Bacteroidota bacterium]|nr:TatD family hydrolase [Bacteroidota bacterium]